MSDLVNAIVFLGVLVALGLSVAVLYFAIEYAKREGFLGGADDVFSRGAETGVFSYRGMNQNTLVSESCNMPDDFQATTLPYCEILPTLQDKTSCYLGCISTYQGGIRGKCYPNILKTYNSYSRELGCPRFPEINPGVCNQNDPCCM